MDSIINPITNFINKINPSNISSVFNKFGFYFIIVIPVYLLTVYLIHK